MKKLLQRLSIWFFRKVYKLDNRKEEYKWKKKMNQ